MKNENTQEDQGDSDYTSVQDSESTEKAKKFSNIGKSAAGIEESGVSSSMPLSEDKFGSSAKKKKGDRLAGSMMSVSESG